MAKPAAKKGAGNPEDEIAFNDVLRANYKKACTLLDQPENATVMSKLSGGDDDAPVTRLRLEGDIGGPAGMRALCAAVMARGAALKPPGYKHLQQLQVWRAAVGDEGAAAVADVVRNGPSLENVRLESVELLDCGVGPPGCRALGSALSLGANATLRSLRLDINGGVGDAGAVLLCDGLRGNRTLQRLHLSYCNVTAAGAAALGACVASPLSGLEVLDVMGNQVGAAGLLALARGARRSARLVELVLADNGIGGGALMSPAAARALRLSQLRRASVDEVDDYRAMGAHAAASSSAAAARAGGGAPTQDAPAPSADDGDFLAAASAAAVAATKEALVALGEALADASCPLRSVALDMNALTAAEAEVLLPFLGPEAANTKVTLFKMDTTLPPLLFAQLSRAPPPPRAVKKKAAAAKKKS